MVRAALSYLLAGGALVFAPVASFAQSTEADPELEALIPDSAVRDPDAWVGETPAAQSDPNGVAAAEAEALDPASPLAPLPDFQLAWPDDAELTPLEPLAPEPDIELAEKHVEAELAAAGVSGDEAAPRLADAQLSDLGKGVELAFPAEIAVEDRGRIENRFADLSSLRRLRDDDDNIAQLARRARADRDLLLRTLRVYGYYDAEVYQSIGGFQPGEAGAAPPSLAAVKVRFDVIPGPQYLFGKIALGDLEATGDDYARLRGSFDLEPGEPVNADAIVAERADLTVELGETGYAFAELGDPDLLIDHARREGDLNQPVTVGGKYAFGEVVSALPKFLSSKHLRRIARFDAGEIYQRSKVDDLRRAILATGLVSTVTVTPREVEKPAPGDPGTVALDVAMTKAPLRTIAGLAGFSSGEGFRVEASWEHRNFIPPEGLFRVRGVAGTREQLAGVTFRRNNFTGRDKVLSLDLYAQTVDRDAFDARTVSFLANFERQSTIIYQKRWTYALGLEAVATGEREGPVNGVQSPRQTFFIGALPGRIALDASDDLLDPSRGFRVGLRVSPEYSIINNGGSATYIKAQLDGSYYQPVSDRIVLAARGRLGTITGAGISDIAPSRRFYAGGGGSVRGYGYQQIGPRDTLGDPSGGRSLSELSFEARVRTGLFGGALAFVPFVDAGAVDETTTPSLRDLRFGAGIGVRYYTNFGPLRIDVGTPLNPRPGDSRIGVYVALGQAF
ncbi:MAG TPA: BamA/TamA family outer membrane protein [Novosphingobium sp.]|nr:BamA/TamA family outer membrane protein [Novosphingobium sp.]